MLTKIKNGKANRTKLGDPQINKNLCETISKFSGNTTKQLQYNFLVFWLFNVSDYFSDHPIF